MLDGEQKASISIFFLILLILLFFNVIVFGYSFYCSLDNDVIFESSISKESIFEVNLTEGKTYEFTIEEGVLYPSSVYVTVNKSSYIPFKEEFRESSINEPLSNFDPYKPKFTVSENGTYQVHIKPVPSFGSVEIALIDINSGVC